MQHLVFLCVANSARSQIAEGLARATAPPGWSVSSAGSDPGTLHPLAAKVMAEIGIDISDHRTKGLDEVSVESADIVVTLCAEEACPTTPPSVERVDWAMPDPAAGGGTDEERLEAFRTTRASIQERIAQLWRRIGQTGRGEQ
ncbi:MAG: arsenate reductase ArsC [Gemmatimonadetes bacterium]|nr:arsenate reductase ArsC [Gemmatimonadota bacterium]